MIWRSFHGAMLAPIRLTNAAAQLPLRGQVRRKEKHPLPSPHRPRPYARWDHYWPEILGGATELLLY